MNPRPLDPQLLAGNHPACQFPRSAHTRQSTDVRWNPAECRAVAVLPCCTTPPLRDQTGGRYRARGPLRPCAARTAVLPVTPATILRWHRCLAAGGSNFTAGFDAVLADAGIQTVLCNVRTPRMNAIAERWIGGCRRELLDRTLMEPGPSTAGPARLRLGCPGPCRWSPAFPRTQFASPHHTCIP